MIDTRKAVALISGGLDSMLAARLMRDHGIHVVGSSGLNQTRAVFHAAAPAAEGLSTTGTSQALATSAGTKPL